MGRPSLSIDPLRKEGASEAFAVFLESNYFGLIVIDASGFIQRINGTFLSMLGFEEADLIDKPLRLVFPDIGDTGAADDLKSHIESQQQRNSPTYLEAISADGTPIKLRLQVFVNAAGGEGLTLCCEDVGDAIGIKAALQRQRELLSAIYAQVADAILLIDNHGYLESFNPIAAEMLALGHRRNAQTHIEDVLELTNKAGETIEPFTEALDRERTVNLAEDIFLELANGSRIPVMASATPLRDKGNRIIGCVIVMRAVSESRRISSRLSWHETHDPLTQLANRRQIENEVLRAIDSALAENCTHGMLYIDLYNFSMVNDTCGHAAGDELLRQLARLLMHTVGDQDVVGRTGNDEFAILLWRRCEEEILEEAERILAALTNFSLPWGERRLKVGASIGIEAINHRSSSEVDVLLSARSSCTTARESGRNRIHYPRQSQEPRANHQLAHWSASIAEALEEQRFTLYGQPIVPLKGYKEAKHYEVLVRMVDKAGQIIPPGRFISAAEASGFIDDIDKWVLEQILRLYDKLPKERQGQYRFSVNLSGNTISDEKFFKHIVSRLKSAQIPPGTLQFEITETAAIKHFDHAVRFISEMNELGCTFALDDFGSGLSSFAYLKQLPVDCIKIDGVFIRKMEVEDVEYSMVSTINHLAHIMGLETIAEGIENQTQVSMLQEMGVDYGQGFFFATPEPLDRIL